ncbi:MAG: LytTR family transcriptional regulator [Bacteroidales bacterium]|nr:LytTR family transcriptional regulator [Bacteroidales bacterium]
MKGSSSFWNIAGHAAFCVFLLVFFGRNCQLRPAAFGAFYKEYLSGLILIAMIYANYLFLIPNLYLKGKRFLFWLFALITVVASGMVEMIMVSPNIQHCFVGEEDRILLGEWFHYFSLVVLRNFGFFCFFFMLRIFEHERRQNNELCQAVRKNNFVDARNEDNVCTTVHMGSILYCEQQENYTHIYDIQGQSFSRYCSLKKFADFWGEEFCLRISKRHLVAREYIQSCSSENVTLYAESTCRIITLPISSGIKEKLDHIIENKEAPTSETDLEKTPPAVSHPQEKVINPDDMGKKARTVYEYIKNHPNCRKEEMLKDLRFSDGTMTRYLGLLKAKGFIQFEGNWKTGGYKAVNNPPEEKEKEAERGEE